MSIIEKDIEAAIRAAIRTELESNIGNVPELADTKILTFWNKPERENDENEKDATNNHIMLVASPSSSAGYMPGIGFEPLRSCSIDIACITHPDSDPDCAILGGQYSAVRNVFESVGKIVWPSGMNFGGMLITAGGAGAFEDAGQAVRFTVELKYSV